MCVNYACSGMSHGIVGHGFRVNESTICVNKVFLLGNTHNSRLFIDQLMKML